MEIFVTGGTGVVGRRAVSQLAEAGHVVSVLSRSPQNDGAISGFGARANRGAEGIARSIAATG